jgi:hypothetical protein
VASILLSVLYFDIANANREQQINQLENNLAQGYSRLFKGRRPEANEVRFEAEKNIASLFEQRAGLKFSASSRFNRFRQINVWLWLSAQRIEPVREILL